MNDDLALFLLGKPPASVVFVDMVGENQSGRTNTCAGATMILLALPRSRSKTALSMSSESNRILPPTLFPMEDPS